MHPIERTVSKFSLSGVESQQKVENAKNTSLEPADHFLQSCKKNKLVDENYRLLLQPDSLLPNLYDSQRQCINRFLDTEISFIKIWEILAHFLQVVESIDIVGGFLRKILLLDPYISKTLIKLGAKITPQDLNTSRHLPDVDMRFRLKEGGTCVKDCTEALVNFIATKLRVNSAWVRRNYFTKFNCVKTGKTEYSIATFGRFYLDENATFPTELECIFVKSLERESLFVQDDLRINILPLILAKMGYPLRPTLTVESHFHKGWQSFFDLVGQVIHVNHPKNVDANGFLILLSYFARGYILGDDKVVDTRSQHKNVSVLPALRERFLACQIPLLLENLKKCLKNHHAHDPIAHITIMYHLHQHLYDFLPEKTLFNFWATVGVFKLDTSKEATAPLRIQQAFQNSIPYQVINATVVLGGFFLLSQSSSRVSLKWQKDHPFLRIKITDTSNAPYLLIPFEPLQAQQMLLRFDKDPAIQEELIKLFFSIIDLFLKDEIGLKTNISSFALEDVLAKEACARLFSELEKWLFHTKSTFRLMAFHLLLSLNKYGEKTEVLFELFPELLFNKCVKDKPLFLSYFSKMLALTPYAFSKGQIQTFQQLLSKPKTFIKNWILQLAHSQDKKLLAVSDKLWEKFVVKFTKKTQLHFSKEVIQALLPSGMTYAKKMMLFVQKKCLSHLSLQDEATMIEKLLSPPDIFGNPSITMIFESFLQRLEKEPIELTFMENAIFAFLEKILNKGFFQEGKKILKTIIYIGGIPASDSRTGFLFSKIVSLEAEKSSAEDLHTTWKNITSLGIPLDNVAKISLATCFLQKAALQEAGFQLLEGIKAKKKPHPNVATRVQPLVKKHLDFLLQSKRMQSYDKAVRLLSRSYKLYLREQKNLDYILQLLEKYLTLKSFNKALVLWKWALSLETGSQNLAKLQKSTEKFLKTLLSEKEIAFSLVVSLISHSEFFSIISSLHYPNQFLDRASIDKMPSLLCPILCQITDTRQIEPVEFMKFFHHLKIFLERQKDQLPKEVKNLLVLHSSAMMKNLLKADLNSCAAFLQILPFSDQSIYHSLISQLFNHFKTLSLEEQLVAFQKYQKHLLKVYSLRDLTEKIENLIDKRNKRPCVSTSLILKTLQSYPLTTSKFFAKLLALWAFDKPKIDDSLLIETFKIITKQKTPHPSKYQENDALSKKNPYHLYVTWQCLFKILGNLKSKHLLDLIGQNTLDGLNNDQEGKLRHWKVIVHAVLSLFSKKTTLSLKHLENLLHFLSKINMSSSALINLRVRHLEEKLLLKLLPLCTSETIKKIADYISLRLQESTLSKILIQQTLKIGLEKEMVPSCDGPILKIATLAKKRLRDHNDQLEIADALLLYQHPVLLPILEKYLKSFLTSKTLATRSSDDPVSALGKMIFRFAKIVTENCTLESANAMFKILSDQQIAQHIPPNKLSLLWSLHLCEQNAHRKDASYLIKNYHNVKHHESALVKWAEAILDLIAPVILEAPFDFYKLLVIFFDTLAEDNKHYVHELQEYETTPVFSINSRNEKFINRFFHCMNLLINKMMKIKLTTPTSYVRINRFIFLNLKKMIEQLPFKKNELANTVYKFSFWIIPGENDYFDAHTSFTPDLVYFAFTQGIFIDQEHLLSAIFIYIGSSAIICQNSPKEIQPQLVMKVMNHLIQADNPYAMIRALKILLGIQEHILVNPPLTELKYLYKTFITKIPQYFDFSYENFLFYEWVAIAMTGKKLTLFQKIDPKVGLETANELIQQLFNTMLDVMREKNEGTSQAELIIWLFQLLFSTRKWGAFNGPQGNEIYYLQIEKIIPFSILYLKNQLISEDTINFVNKIIINGYLTISGIEDRDTDFAKMEKWRFRCYSSKIKEKRAFILIQWLIDLGKIEKNSISFVAEKFYELAKKHMLFVGKGMKKKCQEFEKIVKLKKRKNTSNYSLDWETLTQAQKMMGELTFQIPP